MHVEMTRFMLRVTSAILFGVDQPEFAWKVGEMIDRWVAMNHDTGMGAFVSDPRILGSYDRLLAFAEGLETDIREMIHLRRENAKPADDVLSLLIRANEQGQRVTDEELIGHVALLYGAAHLTTAHTMTWTLFLLAQHPAIMRELHREILDDNGRGLSDLRRDQSHAAHRADPQGKHADPAGIVLFAADLHRADHVAERASQPGHAGRL